MEFESTQMISLINCCINGISLSENLSNRNAVGPFGQQINTRDLIHMSVCMYVSDWYILILVLRNVRSIDWIAEIFDQQTISKEKIRFHE